MLHSDAPGTSLPLLPPHASIVVDSQAHMLFDVSTFSAGPEAMVHLALALASVAPNQTFVVPHGHGHPGLPRKMLEIRENRRFLDIPTKPLDAIRQGDFFILPEVRPCPTDLVKRGAKVYIWRLGCEGGAQLIRQHIDQGCHHFSHTFWLSRNLIDTPLPRSHVVRPYLSPLFMELTGTALMLPPAQRQNSVVINAHDMPPDVLKTIEEGCSAIDAPNLRCWVAHGLSKRELAAEMGRSKIVIAWCMNGAERLPLEAVLFRNVLLTNACRHGSDPDDFPLPAHHRVDNATQMVSAVQRVLNDYSLAVQEQTMLRSVYRGLSLDSMAQEARAFLSAAQVPVGWTRFPTEQRPSRPRITFARGRSWFPTPHPGPSRNKSGRRMLR